MRKFVLIASSETLGIIELLRAFLLINKVESMSCTEMVTVTHQLITCNILSVSPYTNL